MIVADIYEPADFSDEVRMLELARKYHISGVISGCNDFAYLSACYVAKQLGLRGYDGVATAVQIHHKNDFRALQRACGIRHPQFAVCKAKNDLTAATKQLVLPVVVKPVDLTGGKGVAVCRTWDELDQKVNETLRVTRESAIIVEEFVEGDNHGTSMLLKGGQVVFNFFDNEEYFRNKYLVSGAYAPSDLSDEQKTDVTSQVEALAQYAGLCDGLFHCQFIVDRNGLPYLIDPCRRAPGDLYVKLVSYATGINYPMAIVKGQLGLPMDEELNFLPANRCIARECMMAETNGVIESIVIDPEYERHVIEKMQWLHPGDRIENFMTSKAGIVFFEYAEAQELRDRMRELYNHMRIDILAES